MFSRHFFNLLPPLNELLAKFTIFAPEIIYEFLNERVI